MTKASRLPLFLCALLAVSTGCAQDQDDQSAKPSADAAATAESTPPADTAAVDDNPETVVATINGQSYKLDVFKMFFMERLQQNGMQNSPELQQQAFDEFMGLAVTSQEGEKRKLEMERDVVAALQLERMKILANAALADMAGKIEPGDAELKEAYEKLVEQSNRTEYKARHILLKDENEAKEIIEQLDKGSDFAKLAAEKSLGPTGKDGGDLGWFDPSQMVAPFSEAVAKMEPGAYSKEPVHTQFGWHVINLIETRKAQPPAFDEIKPQLIGAVKRQKIAERIAEMRNQAMVDLNEDVVKLKDEAATEDQAAEKDDKQTDKAEDKAKK